MDAVNWVQLITAVLAGLATAIPLVIKLYNTVKEATRSKNWNLLMKMAMDYMKEAEKNYASGADRKAWVLSMIRASAVNINYDLTEEDIKKLEDLIDAICDASKVINNSDKARTELKEVKAELKEIKKEQEAATKAE